MNIVGSAARRGRHPGLYLAALLLAAPAAAAAADPSCAQPGMPTRSLLEQSIRGRALVRESAARHGGADRIAGLRRLHQATDGIVSNGLQAWDPANVDAPDLRRRFTREWLLDFENRRHRRVNALRFDGATLYFVEGYSGGRLWTASADRRLIWTREGTESGFSDALARYVPALVLARAIENISTATWAGQSCASGSIADLVDFSWNERVRLRLHIGQADNRLRRLDATVADPLLGDDLVSYDFEGERIVEGISFPDRVIYRRRGAVFSDVTFTHIEVNPVIEETAFNPPAGLIEVASPSAAYSIGDGAYEMVLGDGTDNYVQFFDLGNAVAVFDAPLSSEVSRRIEEQVRVTLGAKPIAYVVLSHFHDDHIGGVGYFVGLGATIVTTRDSEAVIRRFVAASSRLSGASPAAVPPIDFRFVDDAPVRLQGTGGRSLTVFRLAGLPHVRSMLVAHYPRADMIVNSDLVSEFAPFDRNSLMFARWLERSGAPRVDWIAGGHHRTISAAALQAEAAAFVEATRGNSGAE